jgi:hypothetical protein
VSGVLDFAMVVVRNPNPRYLYVCLSSFISVGGRSAFGGGFRTTYTGFGYTVSEAGCIRSSSSPILQDGRGCMLHRVSGGG